MSRRNLKVLVWEAVGKRPSAALPSSFVTAAYFYVRLIPQDLEFCPKGENSPERKMPILKAFLRPEKRAAESMPVGSLASGHFPTASEQEGSPTGS